ncbi:MAG: hypothetical protein K2X46_19950 [Roseomonas sp.]|nr:hypothetical protein [Roseomonas sp.]
MSSRSANLKLLHERRDQLRAEIEARKARLDEVESLIRMLSGEPPQEMPQARKPRRGDLKEAVLALYEQAGEGGLSSAECVTAAKSAHGLDLQTGSVSSLLSRLKADGILMYDGERYRLRRFAGPRSAA